MARGHPIELATRSFNSKAEATVFFGEIRSKCPPGGRISEEDGLHLYALIERHSEYREKVGCGISYFSTMKNEKYGTKCFCVVRVDGTRDHFSYHDCIDGRPPQKREVSRACRLIVRGDVYKAKDDFFRKNADLNGCVICAATGERVTWDKVHMDHRSPLTFEVLMTTFLAGKGLSFDDLDVVSSETDDRILHKITREDFSDEFRSYHKRVAQFDIVKKYVNLSQSAKNRMRKGQVTLS